jgi:MFS family permease
MQRTPSIIESRVRARAAPPSGEMGPVRAFSAPRRGLVLLFATACGLSVANVYFAHPLLETLARAFSIERGSIGIVVTVTQIGYALGLIFVVPLGDLIDPRRLIVGLGLLSVAALTIVGIAPNAIVLLLGMFVVGLLAVAVQVLVAYAATLAQSGERGRVVGVVTSGVVIGILLARFVSGVLADLGGWRTVYFTSAALTLVMTGLLVPRTPAAPQPSRADILYGVAAVDGKAVPQRAGSIDPRCPRLSDFCRFQRALGAAGAAA